MELPPRDEPVLDPLLDPLLAVLHREHPDVDVVVLGPEPARAAPPRPPAGRGAGAADAVVETALDEVRRRAGGLWAHLVTGEEPPAWLAPGPVPGSVVARSRHGLRPAPPDVLDRLAAHLSDRGWQLRERGGPVQRLAATTGGRGGPLRLDATYAAATGALVVDLVGAPVPAVA